MTDISEEPDLPYAGPVELSDGSFVAVTDSRRSLWHWSASGRELRGPDSDLTVAPAAMLRSGGRLLVAGAGRVGDESALGVAAVTPRGAPDPGFGDGGTSLIRVPGGQAEWATAIVGDPRGRYVTAGTLAIDGTRRLVVARLLGDGRPDPGFGDHGAVVTTLPGTQERFNPDLPHWTQTSSVLLDAEGRIVVAGTTVDAGTRLARATVIRYLDDGRLDPSFGAGRGFVTLAYRWRRHSTGGTLALEPGEAGQRILIGGSVYSPAGQPALARLDSNGVLDRTFDADGRAVTEVRRSVEFTALHVAGNGAVVAIGHPPAFNQFASIVLVRYRPDGRLDPGFGAAGRSCTDLAGDFNLGLVQLGLVVQADGRLVVGGILNSDRVALFLARYRPIFRSMIDCPVVTNRGRSVSIASFVRPGARLGLDVARLLRCQDSSRTRRLGRVTFRPRRRLGSATFHWDGRLAGQRLRRGRCYALTPLSLSPRGRVRERFPTSVVGF